MITFGAITPFGDEDDGEVAVAVGHYATLADANDHVLVVLATGLAPWVRVVPAEAGGFALLTDEERAPVVADELAAYDRLEARGEERDQSVALPHFGPGGWVVLLWGALLGAIFLWQGADASLVERGASSSHGLIDRGEWWRPFTALFLHSDLAHLMGNVALGALFGVLVSRSIGAIPGWLLILAAGTLGNVATSVAEYPEAFRSLGASTAVFGALGILTGFGFYVACRVPWHTPWASILAPIGGGLALLGWFGAGGPGTDVFGHLNGFLAGIVLGLAAAWWRLRPLIHPGPRDAIRVTPARTRG